MYVKNASKSSYFKIYNFMKMYTICASTFSVIIVIKFIHRIIIIIIVVIVYYYYYVRDSSKDSLKSRGRNAIGP